MVSSYNAAILEKFSVEEIEHDVDEAYEIELRIGETRTKLKNFLKKDRQPTRTPYVPFEQASGYILHGSPFSSPFRERTHVSAKPKLPKISLKRFNGDLIKFYPFWESFESTVHNNEQLSAVEKFNYLHSLWDGAAASSIQGLPLTEENYENAVEILKDRFGRKQQIISAHMEELLKLQNCPNENTSQLRQIYDKINIQIRGLEALDVMADKYGSFLIPVIMQRMPSEIAIEIARKTKKEVWSIKEILEIIKAEVEAREIGENANKKSVAPNVSPKKPYTPPKTAANFHLKIENTKLTCVFCGKNHFSSECRTVVDVEKRKEILRKNGRCYRCIGTGHMARNCEQKKKCRNCSGNHHQAICNRREATITEISDNSRQILVSTEENQEDIKTGNKNILLKKNETVVATAKAVSHKREKFCYKRQKPTHIVMKQVKE